MGRRVRISWWLPRARARRSSDTLRSSTSLHASRHSPPFLWAATLASSHVRVQGSNGSLEVTAALTLQGRTSRVRERDMRVGCRYRYADRGEYGALLHIITHELPCSFSLSNS